MILEELKNTKELDTSKVKIFLDLDGVMADFVQGAKDIFDKDYSFEKFKNDSKYRSKFWNAVKQYQKDGGQFWLDLKMMEDANQLWKFLKEYDVEILTATGDPKHGAGEQKKQWVKKHIDPNIKVNLVRKSKEKADYVANNSILIDDQEKSTNPWEQAGGIGILHKNAKTTIDKLKKLGL